MKRSQRQIELTKEERETLIHIRDNDPKPYMRERCSAIIKVADGKPAGVVAESGLLKKRSSNAVRAWLDRYEESGIEGLKIKPGRGRKPAFSPCA